MRVTALLFSLGLILFSFGSVAGQGIYLDHVDGLNPDESIPVGATLTYHMRIVGDGTAHLMLNNGFEFSSPNATWGSLAGTFVEPNIETWFDFVRVINLWSADGVGYDTAGVGLLSLFGTGMPAGYNAVMWTFTIGPVAGPGGAEIELDSSWYPPSNPWMWDVVGEEVAWGGPYAHAIEVECVPPAITSDPVTEGEVGVPYSYDVEATGTPDPTFALSAAPEGMTINAETGLIEWTPTAVGDFGVTVVASNDCPEDATQGFSIHVPEPLTPPVLADIPDQVQLLGVAYSYDVDATGNPAPTYALLTAPAGMSIDENTGVISWMPDATGEHTVLVEATNSEGTDTEEFILTVQDSPTITTTPVTDGQVGEAYSYDVDATGYPTPGFALTASPAGMTIDPGTGIISWTPAAAGDFDVTVTAANGVAPDAVQSFTIAVIPAFEAPVITSSPVTNGVVGVAYSYDVEATGYPVPTFALTASPAGMTINAETGVISWIPAAVGDYDVTVTASNGISPDAEQSYTIAVVAAPAAPQITTTPVTEGQVGVHYYYDVDATGNPVPTYELTTAPSGMTIDAATGEINWDPTVAANFDVTVRAVNGVNPPASQSFTIVVEPALAAPEIVTTPTTTAKVGQLYSYNIAATGYPTPTFALTEAPTGMAINAGVIEWIPTSDQTGDNPVTVVASNGVAPDAVQSWVINVPDQPYTDCWPQPTILKDLENDRILDVRIYNEDPDQVDLNSIRVGNIPPYTGVTVEGGIITTDAFIMRFLGSSGFRPVTADFTATYTVYYDYIDGTPAEPLVGDYALKVYPGDVTFDGRCDMNDVVFMVDFFFNGGDICRYMGIHPVAEFMDINHDGELNPLDLRAVIELAEM